jgi:hypothetical protein
MWMTIGRNDITAQVPEDLWRLQKSFVAPPLVKTILLDSPSTAQ